MPDRLKTSLNWVMTLVGALGLLSQVFDASRALFNKYFDGYTELTSTVFVFLLVIGLVAIVASRPSSTHVALEELPKAVTCNNSGSLKGRANEITTLVERCRRCKRIFVVAQPGVGKSALLRFGLALELQAEGSILPIYVKTLVPEATQGLESELVAVSLWGALSFAEREKLDLPSLPTGEKVFEVLRAIESVLRRRSLLIFDRIDDYVAALGTNPDHCPERANFWAQVRGALDASQLKILMASTPQALSSAQALVGGVSSVVHPLPELRRGLVAQWLEDVDKVLAENGRAVVDPERGWTDLKKAMVIDLSPRDFCLPHQFVAAMHGLTALESLTPTQYRNRGGSVGLAAHYVRMVARETAARLGWSESEVLGVLAALVDNRLGGRSRERGISEMRSEVQAVRQQPGFSLFATELEGRSDLEWAACLDALLDEFVRRVRTDDGVAYELRHTYLAPAIRYALETQDPIRIELAQAEINHYKASGFLSWWTTWLPPARQISLWWLRLRGLVRFQDHRRYMAKSTLRWAPYPLILILYATLADAGVSLPGGKIARRVVDQANVTIFRRPASLERINAGLARSRQLALRELLKRCTPGPWCVSKEGGDNAREEPWLQSQALAAGSADDRSLDDNDRRTLTNGLQTLLQCSSRVTSGQVLQGFTGGALTECPIVEPTIWTGLAIIGALRRPRVLAETTELEGQLQSIQLALRSNYFLPVAADGSTSRGPAMIESPDIDGNARASVYATSLMLLFDVELLELFPGREDVRQEAAALVKWLEAVGIHGGVDKRGIASKPTGWPAQNRPGETISEGVTYQVLYTLARASSLKLKVSDDWERDVVDWAEEIADRDDIYSETSSLYIVPYKSKEGLMSFGHHVRFMWFPWAIGALLEWEIAMPRTASSRDHLVVRRALVQLDNLAQTSLRPDDNPTFRLSEFVFITRQAQPAPLTGVLEVAVKQ